MTKQEFIEKYCEIVYSSDLECHICVLNSYYICLEVLMEDNPLLDYLWNHNITTGLGHVYVSVDDNNHDYKYPVANIGYSTEEKAWHVWTPNNDFWSCGFEHKVESMNDPSYLPCSKDEHINWMISLLLEKYSDAVLVEPIVEDEKGFSITMNIAAEDNDPVVRRFEFDWLDDYNNIPLSFVCENGNDCVALVTQFLKKSVNKLNNILV